MTENETKSNNNETNRVPPLNLTEPELTLLRTILQHSVDSGMEVEGLHSLKSKADKAHRSVYNQRHNNDD